MDKSLDTVDIEEQLRLLNSETGTLQKKLVIVETQLKEVLKEYKFERDIWEYAKKELSAMGYFAFGAFTVIGLSLILRIAH